MYLVCPAGSPPALVAAIDHGADAVYVGFRDQTNARAFPGPELHRGRPARRRRLRPRAAAKGLRGAQHLSRPGALRRLAGRRGPRRGARRRRDHLRGHGRARLRRTPPSRTAAPSLGAGLRHHARRRCATTASASASRAPCCRACCRSSRSSASASRTSVPIEVFAFGSLCIMVEGRCQLSSYVTGASPNRHGVCSPAKFVRWEEGAGRRRSVRLNDRLIDRFEPDEPAGYPTVCKGRYDVRRRSVPRARGAHQPQHARAAAAPEGRGRGRAQDRGTPARARPTSASVTRTWRAAIDRARGATRTAGQPDPQWQRELARHAEGHQTTLGPYHRSWH